MPAPVIASTASTYVTSATSINANLPSGIVAGDLLLLIVVLFGNDTFATPAGWTAREQIATTYSPDVVRIASFERVANGSEGSTVTVARNSGTSDMGALAFRVPSAEFNASSSVSSANYVLGRQIPSVTTTKADALVIAAQMRWYTTITTEPAGWTIQFADFNTVMSAWSMTFAGAGATGVTDFNESSAFDLVATIALAYTEVVTPRVPRSEPLWRRTLGLR